MKKWLVGVVGSVVLAGGLASVTANASSEDTPVDSEVSQEQGQFGNHSHKRGFHKHGNENKKENHELMGTIFQKQEQLINLLLDKNASAIDGVEELQTELANVNEQLNALHEEAKAAHEKMKAQKQDWKDGERPELTNEEKEDLKAKFSEMQEKRDEALALAKQKDVILTQLIEKLS
ncbi:hypothetical protein [Guptibacillus algicola]|uniref:hypothetical protein n=1 Tax=Guptibacillus algicola TaxID=225844 RepID=UPI001CD6F812|nr:hypothetical protein [Alkalihalobacillus algicola]MCA0986728.1 hypothetical protein [Alkalihalobacillus algicola]